MNVSITTDLYRIVCGSHILCSHGPCITLPPRLQNHQRPRCAKGTREANAVEKKRGTRAVQRRIEKYRQQGEESVERLDSSIDSAQRLIQAWQLARLHGFMTELVQAIVKREVENGIEHKCAQREQDVPHCCGIGRGD